MLSTKYHIGTIIALFFALGIGIFIGGTLGEKWMHQTEDYVAKMLMDKYEKKAEENELLQKQIGSLQMMNQSLTPFLQHKKIWWIRPEDEKQNILPVMLESAGGEWLDIDPKTIGPKHSFTFDKQTKPDIVLISDIAVSERLDNELQSLMVSGNTEERPKFIDLSSDKFESNNPKQLVEFILYLKKVVEEDAHEAIGVYRYSGVE